MPLATRYLGKRDNSATFIDGLYDIDSERYPGVLASTASHPRNTQYDIVTACPQYILRLDADRSLHLDSLTEATLPPPTAGFFDTLDQLFRAETQDSADEHGLPFHGGWLVYLSYEMALEVEHCLDLPLTEDQPLAMAWRCPCAIVHDRKRGDVTAVAEAGYEHLLDVIESDFQRLLLQQDASTGAAIRLAAIEESAVPPYLQQVERIKRYIIDGDIFQANLSRSWHARLEQEVSDLQIFRCLSHSNPASFACLVRCAGMTVVSSSPERLVSCRDGMVQTRPIAGTRPRHADEHTDSQLARELISHPKERAEHIMLIDLERNDLGRVCVPGTVEVDELMIIESWEHVHHIVSNIRGRIAGESGPVDLLRAVFPGGTITGCPKVRCIEILAEMEAEPRGAYTGSVGYINTDGSMDFNILIRTMVRQGDTISFRAGGGIVSDSMPQNELEETRAKAKGLLKAFEISN